MLRTKSVSVQELAQALGISTMSLNRRAHEIEIAGGPPGQGKANVLTFDQALLLGLIGLIKKVGGRTMEINLKILTENLRKDLNVDRQRFRNSTVLVMHKGVGDFQIFLTEDPDAALKYMQNNMSLVSTFPVERVYRTVETLFDKVKGKLPGLTSGELLLKTIARKIG